MVTILVNLNTRCDDSNPDEPYSLQKAKTSSY